MNTFQPNISPLGPLWLSALVGFIPLITIFVTLGVLRWKAHIAGLTTLAVSIVIAIAAWGMPADMALLSATQGAVFGLFPIVWIVFMAIVLYQVTVVSGRFEDLRDVFGLLSDDPRVQAMLIAFCFGGLLEALAGFGAPVAISAGILVGLGFPALPAAGLCLLANTVPVAFAAVGLPIAALAQATGLPEGALGSATARLLAHWASGEMPGARDDSSVDYAALCYARNVLPTVEEKARREVEARYTARTVEIFLGGERIAVHMRGSGNGRHTTVPEHMPSSHRRYLDWTPAKIQEEAGRIGPMLSLLMERIIEDRPHPEQGYRSCLGIIGLGKRFGAERLEAAALRALEIGARNYPSVKSILEKGLDKVPVPKAPEREPILHDNIRGSQYYH